VDLFLDKQPVDVEQPCLGCHGDDVAFHEISRAKNGLIGLHVHLSPRGSRCASLAYDLHIERAAERASDFVRAGYATAGKSEHERVRTGNRVQCLR
jgi:hypothetical protein